MRSSSKPGLGRKNLSSGHSPNDEEWTLKPLNEFSPRQLTRRQFPPHGDELDPEDPSTPSASTSTSTSTPQIQRIPLSDFASRNSRNRRNNRHGYVGKQDTSPRSMPGSSGLGEREVVETKGRDDGKMAGGDGGGEAAAEGERIDESKKEVGDVLSWLARLQLAPEGSKLSADQIRINDQLQEDELLAMKAIYGDDVHVLDKLNGLRTFQIHVHVETAGELAVSASFKSACDPKYRDKGLPEEFLYSFNVQYLPPIIMTCLMPKSYPSNLPPYFTLSVPWLDIDRISSLCSMLDNLWSEQPGQEILYSWIEWLHSFSLSHLGLDKGIMLGPYGMTLSGDTRAISGSVSPDVDIPLLKCFNEEKNHQKFLYDVHECCICFSEYAGTEFISLPCRHFFCTKCMKTYADMHIREGTINKLLCPIEKCGGMVPPSFLKRVLTQEEFERWESLLLQKTLDSMSDVAYCPRCETPCIEDEDQHAQCSMCFFSFCTLCRERRHVGIACMTPEMRLRILEERQNSSQIKDEQKRKEQEMINELLSVKEILRDAKQCPSCKMAISRTEGCNKMVCENCGQYFCYRCNKAIGGYDHFWDGGCELFPQEEINMWEQRMNARQVLAQIHVQLFAEHGGRPCPVCRQVNVKVGGNNHIFCWSCQTHYCYLCREIVRRSSQHYGPKGCKQHSAD